MTHQLTAYPDALRPHVAQILRYHFESGDTRFHLGASGQSVTGAVIERARMLSMRMRTCVVCNGTRTETIKVTRGLPIEVDCWRCLGEGEIGEVKKAQLQEQTMRCAPCKGAGTIQRAEYRKGRAFDPNPPTCEQCNGKGYREALNVICGTGEYETAQPIGGEARSEASAALSTMRDLGQDRSRIVLEIAYGEVGRRVERHLDLPVAMAVWPHTSHGKRLLRSLGYYRGEPPFERMHDALSSDEFRLAILASLANTAAIAILELALSHLCAADRMTGGKIAGMAKRLEGARL